jgi:hypothetical protein
MVMEWQWQGKTKGLRETYSYCQFVQQNLTCTNAVTRPRYVEGSNRHRVCLSYILTLSNPIFLPPAYSPALIYEYFGWERGWMTCNYPIALTHCGSVTQICVICVFALQLWKTDDAKLPFNTRLIFTQLHNTWSIFKNGPSGPDLKKKRDFTLN